MLVVFRADASLSIGSGHIMRCLALADRLREVGSECHFIVRQNSGDRTDEIRRRGHIVHRLPADRCHESQAMSPPSKSPWLSCSWEEDAEQVYSITHSIQPDWLVIDHYGLDSQWESVFRKCGARILVIDDLANRPHCSDLLLDQNLGREQKDYVFLTPGHCKHLIGPLYALLKPEFAALRDESVNRRKSSNGDFAHILISMGGVDSDNLTCEVLDSLDSVEFSKPVHLTIIMGAGSPHLDSVIQRASELASFSSDVLTNITDMCERMAVADLAIGAAGGTAWERCCLGLPSIIVVAAENQRPGARALASVGAAHVIEDPELICSELPELIEDLAIPARLAAMSERASNVCDGRGVFKVASAMVFPE